jgi:hypothetical protein
MRELLLLLGVKGHWRRLDSLTFIEGRLFGRGTLGAGLRGFDWLRSLWWLLGVVLLVDGEPGAVHGAEDLDALDLARAQLDLHSLRAIEGHDRIALVFNWTLRGVDCDLNGLGGLDLLE